MRLVWFAIRIPEPVYHDNLYCRLYRTVNRADIVFMQELAFTENGPKLAQCSMCAEEPRANVFDKYEVLIRLGDSP